MKEKRLIQLLNQYLDGQLTRPEREELEKALLESAAHRKFFWQFTGMHGATHEAAKLKWNQSWKTAAQNSAPLPPPLGVPVSGTGPKETLTGGPWLFTWKRAAVGLAAVLMASVTLFLLFENREVAYLKRSFQAQWQGPHTPVAPGDSLRPGRFVLTDGIVQLHFRSGAQVVFQAPADMELISDMEVRCRLGRFRWVIPEQARQFTVHLDAVDVVDLGTEFGVSQSPDSDQEIHVFSGEVEVFQPGRPLRDALSLLENQALRFTQGALQAMEADATAFLTEADLLARSMPENRQKHQTWDNARSKMTADPAARLHYAFRNFSPWSPTVMNLVPQAAADSEGMIRGAQWAQGRWPGKKGLQFSQRDDRIRFALTNAMDEFSLLVWARVDALPNGFVHSLMSGDSEKPGTIRWTISHSGKLRLGLARASSGPEAAWAVGESPTVFSPENFGQWHMITVVYDGQKARHYLNDQQVWSGTMPSPGRFAMNWVEVGNWTARPDHPDFAWAKGRGKSFFDRHFEGRIDEVLILARALSKEELQSYYQAGKRPETVRVVQGQ